MYGSGTTGQVIWIEDIECTGEENQLNECVSEDQYGDKGNCQHSNDVSMICGKYHSLLLLFENIRVIKP